MFLFLRILGAAIGVGTAALVLLGLIAVPEFFVADLMIGAVLLVSALIPARAWAWRGLLAGHGYALGVFTVALAQQLGPQGVVNPALLGVMVATALGLVGLLVVGPGHRFGPFLRQTGRSDGSGLVGDDVEDRQ